MKPFLLALTLVLVGCTDAPARPMNDPGAEAEQPAPEPPPNDDPTVTPEAPGFVVHEWGTFTSVISSEGAALEGLHHAEELLPSFVRVRDIGSPNRKSVEDLPEGVTQKLETPVLYFYSDKNLRAQVDVDFPQGVISEWYPDATRFAPDIGALQGIRDGQMSWDVELFVDRPPSLLPVGPDDVWAPSREVPDATPVRFADHEERFIFYRGLGRFVTPLHITSQDHNVSLHNDSPDPILAAFLLHVHDGGAAITPLGAIAPGARVDASPSPKEIDLDAYVDVAAATLEAALIDTGLYPDEARAMVDTWSISYFHTPGLRVLYVVPRAWTDALLPIAISPTPDELVRTMIGRVELLLPRDELRALDTVNQVFAGQLDDTAALDQLGRFAEPQLRRALDMIDDPDVSARCLTLIEHASAAP